MPSDFHPTRWTLVLRARGEGAEAKAALSELCGDYYQPVLAFLRRQSRDVDGAREMAHTFFADVLSGAASLKADPAKGRFRSYLLGAVTHFAAKQHQSARTLKRGGGIEHVSFADENATAPGVPMPAADVEPLEQLFDREWAFALIARALAAVEAEMTATGKAEQFAVLRPLLTGDAAPSQTDTVTRLRLSENALRVALFRLRQRFREQIRAEVAATVDSPEEIAAELRHLMQVLLAKGISA